MAVVATLRPNEANVDPGATTSFQLTVRNSGSVVDEFSFALVGETAPWGTVTPDRISLFPGTEGTVQVQFAPPRAASVISGTSPFGVRVISREAPATSTVEEGLLTVGTFSLLTADLSPRTVRAGLNGNYRVRIANDGNTPVTVALKGRDPDELLSIQFESPTRTIEAGTTASAWSADAPANRFGSARLKPTRSKSP